MKSNHQDLLELAVSIGLRLPEKARPLFAAHLARSTAGLGLFSVNDLAIAMSCDSRLSAVPLFERYWDSIQTDSHELDELEDEMEEAGMLHLISLVVDAGNTFAKALAANDQQPPTRAKH